MIRLFNRPVKRFFAIGCSFTYYKWTTWPEIVAHDLEVQEFYNLGELGAGNEFMFNRLMQVDQLYNLNEDDLVIICWTNVCREDKFVGNWITPGNIYSQGEYDKEFVKKYYSNPEHVLLHDFAFIKASRTLLEHKKVQWHFLQMLPIFELSDQWMADSKFNNDYQILLDTEKKFLNPSFYEVLWNNNINNKIKNCFDGHPSPREHLTYLQKTFSYDWKKSTIEKISLLEKEHFDLFLKINSCDDVYKSNFTHLQNSLPFKVF